MNQGKSKLHFKRYSSLFWINKVAIMIMQKNYNLSNYQLIVLSWMKGVWTGILISLIVHNLFSK